MSGFCDITDEDSVEALVRAAEEHFGRIDIMVNLVHNPEFTPKNVADMEWKDWNQHLICLLYTSETLAAAYLGSGFKDAVGYFAIVLILLFKPDGLFGRKKAVKV